MALQSNQVTIGTTATQIVPPTLRTSLTVINMGATDVYVGDSGVTIANGALLKGVKGAELTFNTSSALYGITASVSQVVCVLEDK